MPDKRLSPVYYNKMKFAESHIRGSKKLLDVGCGEGGYFHIYEGMGVDYAGIDPDASVARGLPAASSESPAFGEPREQCVRFHRHMPDSLLSAASLGGSAASRAARVKIASAERMPFPDKHFDTVVCMDVIEHVHDPDAAVSEIWRVLKKGGRLVISVPNARYPWTYDPLNAILRLFGNHHLPMGMWAWGHQRLFKREDFLGLLRRHGFRIELVEERTHGFVTFFLNYLPYLGVYVASPLLKKVKHSKSAIISVSGRPVEGGLIFRLFNALNRIDSRFFGRSHGLTICVVARKS